jgi:hypothetical protein
MEVSPLIEVSLHEWHHPKGLYKSLYPVVVSWDEQVDPAVLVAQ